MQVDLVQEAARMLRRVQGVRSLEQARALISSAVSMLDRVTTSWSLAHTLLVDGRQVYCDARRRELIQHPDGEWTIRVPGMPVRLELGTHCLVEAMRRADWDQDQWDAYRHRSGSLERRRGGLPTLSDAQDDAAELQEED